AKQWAEHVIPRRCARAGHRPRGEDAARGKCIRRLLPFDADYRATSRRPDDLVDAVQRQVGHPDAAEAHLPIGAFPHTVLRFAPASGFEAHMDRDDAASRVADHPAAGFMLRGRARDAEARSSIDRAALRAARAAGPAVLRTRPPRRGGRVVVLVLRLLE